MIPEQFNEKYQGLGILNSRLDFVKGLKNRFGDPLQSDTWLLLCNGGVFDVAISNDVREKYPNFETDLIKTKIYYLAFIKNATEEFNKKSILRLTKPAIKKGYNKISADEAAMLSAIIEYYKSGNAIIKHNLFEPKERVGEKSILKFIFDKASYSFPASVYGIVALINTLYKK